MRRINEGVKKLERKAKALSKKVKSYTDATWSQDEKTRRAAFKARDEAQKKAVATYQRLGRKQAEGSMRPLTRAEEASKKLMPSTPENLKDRLMRKHGHKLKKRNKLKTESSRTVKTAKKKLATMRDLTPREKKAMQKQFKRKPGKLDSLAGKLGSENVGRVYT